MTLNQRPNVHDLRGVTAIPEALLKRTESDRSAFLDRVQTIITEVREHGDAALLAFARKFDGVTSEAFAVHVTQTEFDEALACVDPEVIEAIHFAAEKIRIFHEGQKPEEMRLTELKPGVFAGERWSPLDTVACYVPRCKGSFPSVVLQTCIPAVVANVRRSIIVTPPGPDGRVDPATLAAAYICGISEVYKVGGAQAVAAVAYGTHSVPRCLKIVGPGDAWVVAAKRLLADHIHPGFPAGPSECIILADDSVSGELAALDLVSQSEHGPDSAAFLVTSSSRVVEEACQALPRLWAQMDDRRAELSSTVLCGPHGGIVLTQTLGDAFDFVNAYAPEHLKVLTAEPFDLLGKIRNAGEILLGVYTPVTLGNFVFGPNAVLPTSGAAATASPLGVLDYMKAQSLGYVTKAGYPKLAEQAYKFAKYQGFDGHACTVSAQRLDILDR